MNEARIPIDPRNPGHVFACLGFLEAAELLLGQAEGSFDLSRPEHPEFILRAAGNRNPVAETLDFLANARIDPITDGEEYPSSTPDEKTYPVRLSLKDGPSVTLTHWAGDDSRDNFKLHAGRKAAPSIVENMIAHMRELIRSHPEDIVASPLTITTGLPSKFNFDSRGSWTSSNTGYSLDEQKHLVNSSPVVEIMAAWGLENARPRKTKWKHYEYAIWTEPLPPMLARAALSGDIDMMAAKIFQFELRESGRNKIVTHASE